VRPDPAAFTAMVRKAVQAGPYSVERTDTGFTLTAEVTGPPQARGRRNRERLTHVVALDPATATYRVTDTRETLGEADSAGSLLRLDRRIPVDPGVEAHRALASAAAELGWRPARARVSPGLVLGIIAAVFVLVLVVALFLLL
jgi:hypothetical protein